MKSQHILETKRLVGYHGCYFLIVPDHAAGRRFRYTIYRIPAAPSGRVRVVGRELDLKYARAYVKKLIAKEQTK